MTVIKHVLIAFLVLLAAPMAAAAQTAAPPPDCRAPGPAAATPTPSPDATRAHADWWTDQRWRYDSDAQAQAAYQVLVARQSPWPEWHQPDYVMLPAGLRIQMAIAPGQSPECPGGFGTFDRIPSVEFVRLRLAVKMAWKPAIDRVVTYEITTPVIADVGAVGPQIDLPADRYLPGGGSQFQMMVPAAERMQHLRVVEVRPIQ
jgi:hypothetical protein